MGNNKTCENCNFRRLDDAPLSQGMKYCYKFSEMFWRLTGNDGDVFIITDDFFCGFWEERS